MNEDIKWLDLPNAFADKPRRILLVQQIRFLLWKAWLHKWRLLGTGITITARYIWIAIMWAVFGLLWAVAWFLERVVLPVCSYVLRWLQVACRKIRAG